MLFEFFKKNLCGFFVHKWRSTIFPVCGFFVHNSQIGVKNSKFLVEDWQISRTMVNKIRKNIKTTVHFKACALFIQLPQTGNFHHFLSNILPVLWNVFGSLSFTQWPSTLKRSDLTVHLAVGPFDWLRFISFSVDQNENHWFNFEFLSLFGCVLIRFECLFVLSFDIHILIRRI